MQLTQGSFLYLGELAFQECLWFHFTVSEVLMSGENSVVSNQMPNQSTFQKMQGINEFSEHTRICPNIHRDIPSV